MIRHIRYWLANRALDRALTRQAIVRQARAEAARRGHIAAVHRQFERDPLMREAGR